MTHSVCSCPNSSNIIECVKKPRFNQTHGHPFLNCNVIGHISEEICGGLTYDYQFEYYILIYLRTKTYWFEAVYRC